MMLTKTRTDKRKREKDARPRKDKKKKKKDMKTYQDILDLQITAHGKDWTPAERGALKGLGNQAAMIFWKQAKRDSQNTTGFKTAVKAIAKSRKVKAPRVINLTNLQFSLQLARELDIEK